jgi:hypothetical protein
MTLVNEQCREQAQKAREAGNHKLSMRWYNTAAARTFGHKKSDDYERLAMMAAKDASIEYDRLDFATDSEAV